VLVDGIAQPFVPAKGALLYPNYFGRSLLRSWPVSGQCPAQRLPRTPARAPTRSSQAAGSAFTEHNQVSERARSSNIKFRNEMSPLHTRPPTMNSFPGVTRRRMFGRKFPIRIAASSPVVRDARTMSHEPAESSSPLRARAAAARDAVGSRLWSRIPARPSAARQILQTPKRGARKVKFAAVRIVPGPISNAEGESEVDLRARPNGPL